MHEALITRRDVAQHPQQEWIYHPCNCVIVHQIPCHMQIAGHGGPVVFEKCARYLVAWEGYPDVCGWLNSIAEVFPVVAPQVLKRFDAIAFSL
jgi:hypothetical protein